MTRAATTRATVPGETGAAAGATGVVDVATAGGPSDTVRFAALVRVVAAESRRLGLEVPGFRSPPRLVGVDRSLRRRPGSSPSVAVRLGARSDAAVAADLIEGVIVANRLAPPAADHARSRLFAALPGGRRSAA